MRDPVRAFVRIVSWLVPRADRRQFLDEWTAEIAWARTQPGGRLHRARRASGALFDAVTLRFQDWSFDMIVQDVRYALRLARRRIGFTAVIVLTLALGIGANTAIFSVVNAVLLRPLPYGDPERLFVAWEDDRANGTPRSLVSPGNFIDWTEQSQTFEFTRYFVGSAILTSDGEATKVPIALVSGTFHDVLGAPPLLGRAFSQEDGAAGQPRVVVISHGTWQKRFGGDPGLVGRDIRLDDEPHRVIGVMPRGFFLFDREIEIWRPHVLPAAAGRIRNLGFLTVVGRLRPGVTVEEGVADMAVIAARGEELYPATNHRRGINLVPIREQVVGDVRRPLYALSIAVGLVLLMGCANIANLLLASGQARRRELALRAAVGASRARLTRQLLMEGIVYAGLAGGVGLVMAYWSSRALGTLASTILPQLDEAALDWRVLTFTLSVSLLTGLLFAVLPAWHGSRTNLQHDLLDGARPGAGPAARRTASALVVAELVLAVSLVSGASLAVRSFWKVYRVETGFASDHVLTAKVTLPMSRYNGFDLVTRFYEDVVDRLSVVPGIMEAGVTNTLPLADAPSTAWLVPERQSAADGEAAAVASSAVTPRYFGAMGIRLLDGEIFTSTGGQGAARPAVINRTLAERFFPGRSPIGQRIRLGPVRPTDGYTIVAVVADVRQQALEHPAAPEVWVRMADSPHVRAAVVIRVDAGDPEAFIPVLRTAVAGVDPDIPLSDVVPLGDLVGRSAAGRRASTILLSGLAAVALLLALVGIYGVMAHRVSQRVPEIGVRMALGAQRGDLLRMILRQGMGLALGGLVLGQLLAMAGGRLIRSMLFGVGPTDPLTFVVVTIAVLAVSAVACYVPARRAARLDPVSALRE
jgi:putative ABC transport system permease protein